jgi:hypothetical protein
MRGGLDCGAVSTDPEVEQVTGRCNQFGQELVEIDNPRRAPDRLPDLQSLVGRRQGTLGAT